MADPTGYAVLTADDHFVGIWVERATAAKILNRSPSAKGERIAEYAPAAETLAYRAALQLCLERMYNPFEPDNQSEFYLRIKRILETRGNP